MLARAEGLACARGGVPVLEGVGFTLAAGEALLLTGRNGAGKTTLLRTVAGLQPPLAGSLEVAEGEIAYASHADGIKPTLTVEENLRFWARIFGRREIDGALDAFDLAALADRQGRDLSAGQKRRLGLARLLVTGRRLWLMDEPTASLDTASAGLVAAALSRHLAAGGAALIATHLALDLEAGRLDLSRHGARLPVEAEA